MAEKTLEEMREAVEEIRAKMAAAAREAGRDPASVQLCAACKTRTADMVAASAALPIDVFGENNVQELCANFDAGAYCGKPSHFIGHLQTNKIKKVLGRASIIQSVDSEHLLAAIEKEAAKAGIVQNVLLEVNIGGEESKTGVSPGTALAAAGCRRRPEAHPGQGPDGHSPGEPRRRPEPPLPGPGVQAVCAGRGAGLPECGHGDPFHGDERRF